MVISNDSDLAEPIYQAKKRFGIKVVVLHPLRVPAPGLKPRPKRRILHRPLLTARGLPVEKMSRRTRNARTPGAWEREIDEGERR